MAGPPVTNHDLAELLAESGHSRAALARKINTLASDRHGLDLRYNQSSIYWWLRGRVPEAPTPALLADVLQGWLGRPVSPDDLGFIGRTGRVGLAVAASAEQAAAEASQLWTHLARRCSMPRSPFVLSAAISAGFDWHFAPVRAAPQRPAGERAVGGADIDRLRRAHQEFVALDRANGGGHAFVWLIDYLERTLPDLLSGRYTTQVGRELFLAAATLTELAGWMAFDQHQRYGQGMAQRLFVQALSLAHQSGERSYAAHVLSNLATQALFLGHGGEAARLARAARSGAGSSATPTLLARLSIVEARGWALTGDRAEARAAISRADVAMARSQAHRDPAWLATFTPAHYAGHVMHALRDLRQFDAAISYADQALALPDSSIRARALHQTLLASVHLGRGDLDAACATGRQALAAVPQLTSARLTERLRELNRCLAPHRAVGCVRDYTELARELLIQ